LTAAPATEPPTASFIAALWRTENANAAAWLLEEVWPRVRLAVPRAELRLAGARPPEWLQTMASTVPGVTLTGFVEDLAAEYQRALVCLAPLTDPSGLKVKVVQAMVYGRAVVARPPAIAGIPDVSPDLLGGVSDSPAVFAEQVSDLLLDPLRASAVGRRAAQWACEHFDFGQDVGRAAVLYQALSEQRRDRGTTQEASPR
jgi:glycosyltransferase involved in cell wall biosynthesis